MTTLFAGPFMGEFGWELFKWQGYIRAMSRDYDKVIVASRPSSLFLYKDFASELVPFEVNSYHCEAYKCFDDQYDGSLDLKYPCNKRVFFETHAHADSFFRGKSQEFFNYGSNIDKIKNRICFHARDFSQNTEKGKGVRDWGKDRWVDLASRLEPLGLEIYSVGLAGSAYHVPGTINGLDMEMQDLSKILAESQFVVGASSGVMHFATLCNCPQMVWTEKNAGATDGGNVNKYQRTWNPFSTPVKIITEGGWKPSVDLIEEEIKEWIS